MAAQHILVVDDDRMMRDFVAQALEAAGHRVTRAASGTDALKAARSDRPDLAVVDLLMPGMDGFQLCAFFRRDMALGFPVVVITGRCAEQDCRRALDAGAADYLVKPFTDRQLLASVEKALAEKVTTPQDPQGRS